MKPKPKSDPFSQPSPVRDVEMMFGGRMEKLLPKWENLPDEFRRGRTPWNDIVSRWFFRGLPAGTEFVAKAGIDALAARKHLKAILVSWEPKHEHKEAGAAYLLSLWFESVNIPE